MQVSVCNHTRASSSSQVDLLDSPAEAAAAEYTASLQLPGGGGELVVGVARARGGKCSRCWNYSEQARTLGMHTARCAMLCCGVRDKLLRTPDWRPTAPLSCRPVADVLETGLRAELLCTCAGGAAGGAPAAVRAVRARHRRDGLPAATAGARCGAGIGSVTARSRAAVHNQQGPSVCSSVCLVAAESCLQSR